MGCRKGRITVLKRDAGLMLRKEDTPGEGGEVKRERTERNQKSALRLVWTEAGFWGGEMTE